MNNEWLLYDMNLYRDSFLFNDSINKLLGNYQPDMFQALRYEGKAV